MFSAPHLPVKNSHIAILLVYMTELEPDIPRCQWSRWIVKDVSEALRTISPLVKETNLFETSRPDLPGISADAYR